MPIEDSLRRLRLDPAIRALFDQYMVVVEDRLVKKKLPRAGRLRVIGAIVSKYMLAHRREIMDEFAQVRLETAVGTAIPVLSRNGLSLAATTLAANTTAAAEDEDPRGHRVAGSTR